MPSPASETTPVPLWRVTTDRFGLRAYALPTGQVVCKDGVGVAPVTVYYAGFHDWRSDGAEVGCTSTVREAKEWAEADARQHAARDAKSNS